MNVKERRHQDRTTLLAQMLRLAERRASPAAIRRIRQLQARQWVPRLTRRIDL